VLPRKNLVDHHERCAYGNCEQAEADDGPRGARFGFAGQVEEEERAGQAERHDGRGGHGAGRQRAEPAYEEKDDAEPHHGLAESVRR